MYREDDGKGILFKCLSRQWDAEVLAILIKHVACGREKNGTAKAQVKEHFGGEWSVGGKRLLLSFLAVRMEHVRIMTVSFPFYQISPSTDLSGNVWLKEEERGVKLEALGFSSPCSS